MTKPMKRRQFMKVVTAAGVSMLVPLDFMSKFAYAASSGPKRRHLINLMGAGGADSAWFHNAMYSTDLDGLVGAFVSNSDTGFPFDKSTQPYMFTVLAGGQSEKGEAWTHPDGKTVLGPGMKFVFDNPDELKNLCIWKGLGKEADHTIGNQLLLQGNSSSYALSYSAITAGALASNMPGLPLHYLLLAESPGGLFTNSVMNKGAQIPVCVNGFSEVQALTQPAAADLSGSARDVVKGAVDALSARSLASSLNQKVNQEAALNYGTSFDSSVAIYGSNMLLTPEFAEIFHSYLSAVGAAFNKAGQNANIQAKGTANKTSIARAWIDIIQDVGKIGPAVNDITPQQWLAGGGTYMNTTAFKNSVGAFKDITSSGYLDQIMAQVFSYAMADYVISRPVPLTAVVDLPAWPGFLDPHGGDVGSFMDEFAMQLRTWACLRNLINRLKSTTVPEGRLYDITTVVFATELDRLHYHNVGTAASTRVGTNHGETASVIMAGAGIANGHVVGDFNHGPNVHSIASYGKDQYLKPVPIDSRWGYGQADPKGEVTSTLSLLPTVLAAFGVSVPPQQKSDHLAVAAVLAKDPPKDTT